MTEIDYKRSEMSTLGEIAEGLKLTAQTVKRHVEAAGLEPVWKVGGANLYVIAQVTEILAKRGHGKEVGYIHPDQHREVVERAQQLAIENATLTERLRDLELDYLALASECETLGDKLAKAEAYTESIISG